MTRQDHESKTSGDDSDGGQVQSAGRVDARARTEQRLLIQFLADQKFMRKLEEVKSLLSNKMPNATFEDLFEITMNEFIDRHSPVKREERRRKRGERTAARRGGKSGTDTTVAHDKSHANDAPSRRIPAPVRDAVFKRDGGSCTFVGKNGKRCGSTHNLQVDHIKPFALGGRNTQANLRLLCGKHNRREARRTLGARVMDRFVRKE